MIWLQDILDAKFGKGDTTVICPITDAFVAHHGALGGFVRVWCAAAGDARRQIIDLVGGIAGDRAGARQGRRPAACFDLPPDREGDVAVIARRRTSCIGAAPPTTTCRACRATACARHGGVAEAQGAVHPEPAAERRPTGIKAGRPTP